MKRQQIDRYYESAPGLAKVAARGTSIPRNEVAILVQIYPSKIHPARNAFFGIFRSFSRGSMMPNSLDV
jgi:hypothetical protein